MKRIDESVVPGSFFIHFQIQPCKSKVSLNFNNSYLSEINIWITALAMNLHPTYDLRNMWVKSVHEQLLLKLDCKAAWVRPLTDRLALLLPDTHILQAEVVLPAPASSIRTHHMSSSPALLVKAGSNIDASDHRQRKCLWSPSSPKCKPNMIPILKEERPAGMT